MKFITAFFVIFLPVAFYSLLRSKERKKRAAEMAGGFVIVGRYIKKALAFLAGCFIGLLSHAKKSG